mmetsp:Transcript_53525/g.150366  ORF Transcript_53525/g.150366 Transcript_53525/m.150366 type:complete len:248 (-) Transcript_53525:107-850(-)
MGRPARTQRIGLNWACSLFTLLASVSARLLRQHAHDSGRKYTGSASAVPLTAGDLLDKGDRLRSKASAVARQLQAVEKQVATLETTVAALNGQATQVSSDLAAALKEVQDSSNKRQKMQNEGSDRNYKLHFFTRGEKAVEFKARVVSNTLEAHSNMKALSQKLSDTEAQFQSMLPGGTLVKHIDALQRDTKAYEEAVLESVDRVFTANNSELFESYKNRSNFLLTNLSHVAAADDDELAISASSSPC